jgi:hypothetical protein
LTPQFLIKTNTNSLRASTQTIRKDGLRPGYLFVRGSVWISLSNTTRARIFWPFRT